MSCAIRDYFDSAADRHAYARDDEEVRSPRCARDDFCGLPLAMTFMVAFAMKEMTLIAITIQDDR